MKKYICLLVLLLATTFSFAQTDSIHLPDTAKVTFGKVYNDVKAGISGLAAGLKVGAEHVYVILVRQQYVKAIVGVIYYLFFYIFCLCRF